MDELDKAMLVSRISQIRDTLESDMIPSRELSLCLTKLDEAVMWLDRAKASLFVSEPLR